MTDSVQWVALAAAAIHLLVRAAKTLTAIPPRWRPLLAALLGGAAMALDAMVLGTPWDLAAAEAIVATGLAVLGHDVVVEGLLGGREVSVSMVRSVLRWVAQRLGGPAVLLLLLGARAPGAMRPPLSETLGVIQECASAEQVCQACAESIQAAEQCDIIAPPCLADCARASDACVGKAQGLVPDAGGGGSSQ